MFDSNWDANQSAYLVISLGAIATITFLLVRAFRRKDEKRWPVFCVGTYNILLLFLYLFGMFTQVSWEGFGFFPLIAFTLPWSWLLDSLFTHLGIAEINFFGGGLADTFFDIFLIHNVLAASANSCILYFLLKRRQKKHSEDEAWEQARRGR